MISSFYRPTFLSTAYHNLVNRSRRTGCCWQGARRKNTVVFDRRATPTATFWASEVFTKLWEGVLSTTMITLATLVTIFLCDSAIADNLPKHTISQKAIDGDPKHTQEGLTEGMGWLGVRISNLEGDEAIKLGFDRTVVRVEMVFENSPAHSSNLQSNDIILKFDQKPLKSVEELIDWVSTSKPGREVIFTLSRNQKEIKQRVVLGLKPDMDMLMQTHFQEKPAPPLSVRTLKNAPVELSAYQGKVILLDFWATWCGPCKEALPHIEKLHKKYAKDGLIVIGISGEEQIEVANFIKVAPVSYTIATDQNRETIKAYWISAYPTVFIINPKGNVEKIVSGTGDQILNEVEQTIKTLLKVK